MAKNSSTRAAHSALVGALPAAAWATTSATMPPKASFSSSERTEPVVVAVVSSAFVRSVSRVSRRGQSISVSPASACQVT